jgi:hypothetical protein
MRPLCVLQVSVWPREEQLNRFQPCIEDQHETKERRNFFRRFSVGWRRRESSVRLEFQYRIESDSPLITARVLLERLEPVGK